MKFFISFITYLGAQELFKLKRDLNLIQLPFCCITFLKLLHFMFEVQKNGPVAV
jgi:hypothetical protein